MPSENGESTAWGWVLVLALAAVAVLGAWFPRSPEPLQSWDQATHLLLAGEYHDAWAREGFPAWHRLRQVSSFYPPFYHVCVAGLFAVVGPSARAASLFGGAMLLTLALAAAAIGRRLYDPATGWWTASFVLASPSFVALAGQPLLDLTLATLVALTVWCTLTPRFLASWPRALGFGLLVACGLLTKWVYPAFVAGPLLLRLVRGPRVPIQRWLLAALTAGLLAGGWYLPNASELVQQARASSAAGLAEGDPSGLAPDSLAYYALAAVMFFPLPVRLLLLVAAVPAAIAWSRRARAGAPGWEPDAWLTASWLAVPLVVFTAIDNKDPRYIAGAAPALAVLAARVVGAIGRPRAREALRGLIVAYALVIHLLIWRSADPHALVERSMSAVPWLADLVGLDAQAFVVPDATGWPVREVVERIRGGLTPVSPHASLAVVPDLPYVNAATLRWAARQSGYDLRTFHPDRTPSLAEYSIWEYALVKPVGAQGTAHATQGSRAITDDVMARRELLPPVWAFGSPSGPLLLARTRHSIPPASLRPRDGLIDLRDAAGFWHLGEGWSFLEPWGRWALGAQAVLRVELPPAVAQRVTLSMTPPDALVGAQVVTACFRGRRVRSFRLDQPAWAWEDVTMDLPKDAASGGIDELRLTFSRSLPAGGADAARTLSAAVRSVRFEPLPD